MPTRKLTRRRFLLTTAASTTLVAMPYVRGSYAAGRLSLAIWDHFVPGANATSKALIEEWATREKVEVQIDYINNIGGKLLVTVAAEAQARVGHDIVYLTSWLPSDNARNLEPVDDVMEALIEQNGAVNPTVEYLGKSEGHWIAVPATIGSQLQGPCSRIDLMKRYAGIDVQTMYPAGAPPKADNWTLDTFFTAAEACHKAGFPFGIGLGTTEDSVVAAGQSSIHSGPCWSTPRATSRSIPNRCVRHSNIIHGSPGFSRPTRPRGITHLTTNGSFRGAER